MLLIGLLSGLGAAAASAAREGPVVRDAEYWLMREPDEPETSSVAYIGPFEHHDVVLDGHEVPYLRATPVDGGQIDLTLDRRFGLLLSVAEAERFVPFLAPAIAIASGYTSHPGAERGGPNQRHPFPNVTQIFAEGV
jgi:hypothetical protein